MPNKTADIQIAYLPLVDSAPFIMAEHLGLFRRHGLQVTLHQEVSWAIVRDKLATGALDAAQMLAPLPAMTTLGVSGLRVPLLTGLGLSTNGNGITLSARVWAKMLDTLGLPAQQEVTMAEVAGVIGKVYTDSQAVRQKLTFAVVHGFSTHAILLRKWLRGVGLDPDRDVSMIVVPPSQMVDSLTEGVIDGYCAGEPWNTLAISSGQGVAAAWGVEVWANAPDKVLCVTEPWHEANPQTHLALRVALLEACHWLAQPDNALEAARVMSTERYLGMNESNLVRALSGKLARTQFGDVEVVGDFLSFFGPEVNEPGGAFASEIFDGCFDLLGRPVDLVQRHLLTSRCLRTDLYRQSLNDLSGFVSVLPS